MIKVVYHGIQIEAMQGDIAKSQRPHSRTWRVVIK